MRVHQTTIGTIAAATLGVIGAPISPARAQPTPTIHVAHLHGLNVTAAGMHPAGEARFTVRGDSLTIDVTMKHVPANMEHLQHMHGFPNGKDAVCAPATADVNHDGIVDLAETEPYSGTTMVPFTADPVSMQILTDTYPKAAADSSYHYTKTVSLSALEAAFTRKFPGQKLDLARRVVYVHGVPSATKLPPSVASLGSVAAQVTIPIACGKIERSGR